MAIPRLPYDVLFAIGGWYNSLPTTIIETYDDRAKMWVSVTKYNDPNGPRVHHGAVVINHNIYFIGGMDHDGAQNSCRIFDTITKIWKEVSKRFPFKKYNYNW